VTALQGLPQVGRAAPIRPQARCKMLHRRPGKKTSARTPPGRVPSAGPQSSSPGPAFSDACRSLASARPGLVCSVHSALCRPPSRSPYFPPYGIPTAGGQVREGGTRLRVVAPKPASGCTRQGGGGGARGGGGGGDCALPPPAPRSTSPAERAHANPPPPVGPRFCAGRANENTHTLHSHFHIGILQRLVKGAGREEWG
jgi:hypothetical protein